MKHTSTYYTLLLYMQANILLILDVFKYVPFFNLRGGILFERGGLQEAS